MTFTSRFRVVCHRMLRRSRGPAKPSICKWRNEIRFAPRTFLFKFSKTHERNFSLPLVFCDVAFDDLGDVVDIIRLHHAVEHAVPDTVRERSTNRTTTERTVRPVCINRFGTIHNDAATRQSDPRFSKTSRGQRDAAAQLPRQSQSFRPAILRTRLSTTACEFRPGVHAATADSTDARSNI